MKEFWIEIGKTSPSEKDKLLKIAEVADATLEGTKATLASDKSQVDILTGLDQAALTRVKREGKKVAIRITIKGKEDENTAVKAAELSADYIIINCLDWRVIPLENLIAKTRGKSKLIAEVSNAEEAKLVSEALELGTDGVLLKTADPNEIMKTAAIVKEQTPKLILTSAKITSVKQIGTGARVCVDTCDLMTQGEGLLVGSQSAGLFLVEAEVHENPYVASRPFRVNAGSVSMYTLGSLQNTRYLSEFKAGDEVIIINREGKARKANVGRVKIEFRPLILIEAEVEGKHIKTILQNAETIRLVTPKASTPVTELKADDEVLAHIAAKGGRHFGVSVPEETVIER
ncbi:MAG TPA: 3-dehydroquinate synthase II [Candidatus Bathyarchaeia archaeon]|nr:3-dehydroquinate synthase II [Candidatus Bathyarchaeia archaeon]